MAEEGSDRVGGRWRLLGLLGVGAVVIGAGATLPISTLLTAGLDAVRDAGPLGQAAFVGAYALATITLVPASWLTLGAGAVWGPWVGLALVWPGAVLGATGSFLLGRTALRGAIAARIAAQPRLAAVEAALGRRGATLALLLRLSPVVPFGILNYALGMTPLTLGRFIVSTAVGILPGTFLYVYLGSTVPDVAALADGRTPDGGWASTALTGFGLLVTVAVTVWITRIARGALDDALEDP